MRKIMKIIFFFFSTMYVRGGRAAKLLDVSQTTLRLWADTGKIKHIKLPNGERRYDLSDFAHLGGQQPSNNPCSRKLIYARVSTPGQRDDLQRQVDMLKSVYPGHDVITDVGSGINFKRKGLQTVLERAMSRSIDEVVVSHKDRLARFAFDLISWMLQKHGVKIVVQQPPMDTPEQELVDDLLSIVTVFACRSYGRRSHQSKRAKVEDNGAKEGRANCKPSGQDQGVSAT